MSAEGLDGFRAAVLADRGLQDELLATSGRPAFVILVVERAAALGFDVEPSDVDEGLRESRAAWGRQWI